MKEKTNDYIFYADCHGLISVTPYNVHMLHGLELTCKANVQRFPVYGMIPLTKATHDTIQEMVLSDNGRKVALIAIKDARYSLPQSNIRWLLGNMEKIPNDNLDPFWSDPETNSKVSKKLEELGVM